MKPLLRSLPGVLALGAIGAVAASPAHAHFKLLKPTAWIVEGETGDPQKQGPCGTDPAGADLTNEVTEVKAGETIMVEFEETIHHPGWFRIAIDADRSKFEEIEFPSSNCTYDMDTVPEEPHGNVLVDGLAKDENLGGANRKFAEMVKIPDEPCEKCTLQVIQVMADAIHAPPGCIYYHCADLKIVAAEGGATTGSAGAPAAGAAGAAGAAIGGSAGAASAGEAGAAASTAGAGGASATSSGAAAAAGEGAKAAAPSSGSAGTGTRASGSTAAASTPSGTAGKPAAASTSSTSSGTAGTKATSADSATAAATGEAKTEDSGGCAVAQPGGSSGMASAALLSVVGMLLGARRRRRSA
jgi:MYXO-CTERM domain-containing protein